MNKAKFPNNRGTKAKAGSWITRIWVPNTAVERAQENHELDNLTNEMAVTISGLSPEMQSELNALAESNDPREAERQLINYVVNEDHFKQLRKDSRAGSFKDEPKMKDRIYLIALIPAILALYVIFSWLFNGQVFGHSFHH